MYNVTWFGKWSKVVCQILSITYLVHRIVSGDADAFIFIGMSGWFLLLLGFLVHALVGDGAE